MKRMVDVRVGSVLRGGGWVEDQGEVVSCGGSVSTIITLLYLLSPLTKPNFTWYRLECNNAHIHPGIIAGIYGSVKSGAYSIVLNGGYDDDLDQGEKVYDHLSLRKTLKLMTNQINRFYTGSGGREKARGGKQIENQTFDNRFNKSLQVRTKSFARGTFEFEVSS